MVTGYGCWYVVVLGCGGGDMWCWFVVVVCGGDMWYWDVVAGI